MIEFVASQKRLADSPVEIDYDTLAKIDEMSDGEAVIAIDAAMRSILFD